MPETNITKRALGTSLKTLMAARPFAKISVGDICELCGMNRKSFYYHFQDKYDLLGWVFDSEFMQLIDPNADPDVWLYLRRLCAYFAENRLFYLNAFAIEGQNAFSDTFNEALEAIMGAYWQQAIPDGAFREFYGHFYGDALRCAIVRWLRDHAEMGSDTFVDCCRRAVEHAAAQTGERR